MNFAKNRFSNLYRDYDEEEDDEDEEFDLQCGMESGENHRTTRNSSAIGKFTSSLEDLVTSFDDNIAKCLKNMNETTEKLAPVRTPRE